MKRVLFYLLLTLIMVVPFNVNAISKIAISCDKTEISPSEELKCTLLSEVDDNINFNKVDLNIDIAGAQLISFVASSGFEGNITDNKLVVNSGSLMGNATIGSLNIKFNNDNNSTRTIKLNDIKFYNGEDEVATSENAEAVINIKKENIPASLESLSVNECGGCKLSPSFKTNIKYYTVTTKSEKININAKGSNGATVSGAGVKSLTKENETFELKVTSTSGDEVVYKVKVTKQSTADATLKSLSIDKGSLTPNFTASNTSYTAIVDSDKIVISATANDSKSTIEGIGEKTLEYGNNDFTIKVTAYDGTTKNYLITINRTDNRNENANLKDLKINGEEIDFDKDIVYYTYNLEEDISKLEIDAIPEQESAKVEITGNEGLKSGKNVISIKVTAEDGSEKTYKVMVIKDEVDSKKGKGLKELTIKGYDIDFSSDKYEYIITIKDEKKLNITTLVEEGCDVEVVGNESLQDGSIIKIIVTDEEENSVIYKIKIKVDNSKEEVKTDNSINYIPIIMISLLVILFIANVIVIIKRIKNKDK
ncbi:MAG: cadherin-like beta sandwich domain-containing protein [Bacilli bacterium]|nr:cadherin-like beta sandwich domain-containing protein [Bacilli bacterium]